VWQLPPIALWWPVDLGRMVSTTTNGDAAFMRITDKALARILLTTDLVRLFSKKAITAITESSDLKSSLVMHREAKHSKVSPHGPYDSYEF
ncbi:unnamed protein product, partial [Rotaria socialis]